MIRSMRKLRRRSPLAPGLLITALLVSACGSSLQVDGATVVGSLGGVEGLDGAAEGTDGARVGDAVAGGTAIDPVTGQPLTAGADGTAGGGAGGAGSTGGAGGPGAGGGGGSVGGSSGGKLEIGFVVFPDANAFAASLGGSGDTGDQEAQIRNAVKWANANGGLNGQEIVPVFFEVELTSAQPYSVTYQEICQFYTVDHKVPAVVLIANAANDLADCLARKNVMLLASGHFIHDATDYRALPNLVTPREAGSDRVGEVMLDELAEAGALKAGERLGLLVMDYGAPNRTAERILAPAVRAKGATLTTYKIPPPTSTPGISNSVSAVQAATLRFASEGIRTVMFLCPGCAPFFIQNAQSQEYFPRYLLTSYDTPLGLGKPENARSLTNAIAIGWEPDADVGTFANQPEVRNASREQCRAIQKAYIKDDVTAFVSGSVCGAVLDLRAFATKGGGTDGRSLTRGAGALGTAYPHAMTLRTKLSPARRDGAAAFRTLRYVASCTCLKYDSTGLKVLP
jgi:hypothetical protein